MYLMLQDDQEVSVVAPRIFLSCPSKYAASYRVGHQALMAVVRSSKKVHKIR